MLIIKLLNLHLVQIYEEGVLVWYVAILNIISDTEISVRQVATSFNALLKYLNNMAAKCWDANKLRIP